MQSTEIINMLIKSAVCSIINLPLSYRNRCFGNDDFDNTKTKHLA